MKKIHNIIDSELIVRVNNVKFRQEYGEIGKGSNITEQGNSTLFHTEYVIDKVLYLTVNGVNLIEGVHYVIVGESTIAISNFGDPLKSYSGTTTTILVGYHHRAKVGLSGIVGVPPIIVDFYLNRQNGREGSIVFNFNIEKRDGKNIYWSILKDGDKTPLYSGVDLHTVNGYVTDSIGNPVLLEYILTATEVAAREGDVIPFTLVVVYDLHEDGTHLDEKLLATTTYTVEDFVPIVGNVVTLPAFIDQEGVYAIDTSYSITTSASSPLLFTWELVRTFDGGNAMVVASGNQGDPLNNLYTEDIGTSPGDSYNIRYTLTISENGAPYRVLASDRVNVAVSSPIPEGRAGYLDANILYQGGAGAISTLAEYAAVPDEAYTKAMDISIVDSGVLVGATVNTFGGTVTDVVPMYEIPNSWGPIKFYNGFGVIDFSAFSIIDLQNGVTAYLYKNAPSNYLAPTDFYIIS